MSSETDKNQTNYLTGQIYSSLFIYTKKIIILTNPTYSTEKFFLYDDFEST